MITLFPWQSWLSFGIVVFNLRLRLVTMTAQNWLTLIHPVCLSVQLEGQERFITQMELPMPMEAPSKKRRRFD